MVNPPLKSYILQMEEGQSSEEALPMPKLHRIANKTSVIFEVQIYRSMALEIHQNLTFPGLANLTTS